MLITNVLVRLNNKSLQTVEAETVITQLLFCVTKNLFKPGCKFA